MRRLTYPAVRGLLVGVLIGSAACSMPDATAEEKFQLGTACLDRQEWPEAVDYLSQAIHKNPQLAKAYNNRGLALSALKDYEGAISDYTTCLSSEPRLAETLYNRGVAEFRVGRRIEAVVDLTEAIKLSPAYARAYAARALVFRDSGDIRSALADFRKALDLSPPDWADRAPLERELARLNAEPLGK